MANQSVRVAYGRINRRSDGQDTLQLRSFADDMRALADSHRTETVVQGRRWIASDLELRRNDDVMVGVLGYAVEGQVRNFSEEDFSWLKGQTYVITGALEETVVPFAVDLREHRRWVAVATSARIQHTAFAFGLKSVLNAAVEAIGLLTTDWDVDMVTSRSNVLDWVAEHPTITYFRRVVKFSNPGRNLDDDRADMRALGATTRDERYRALGGNALRLQGNPAFLEMLEGLERGDISIELEDQTGGVKRRYVSRDKPDEEFIDRFDDLSHGRDSVLQALLVYSDDQLRKGVGS